VKVQEIHRRAFRLKLLGLPTKVIAARIRRSPDTVSLWFRDRDIFQAYMEYRASFDAEENERLHRLYGVVVDTIHDLLLHGNENTKYQLCLSILKMRGELPERLIVEHHEPQIEEELREAIRLTEERIQRRVSEIERILERVKRQ
jgi:hypothetical protein